MSYLNRLIEAPIKETLARGKSILLLGARQTGKTTLNNQFNTALTISLIKPDIRQRYEQNPAWLIGEVEAINENNAQTPLVIIDEVQKVPTILDSVQDLIDRRIAKFVLTGSSARKLRMGTHVNLLPGRVVSYHLDPLTWQELSTENVTLTELLLYGSLPGIALLDNEQHKEEDLISYVSTYLEEEIRAEAVVRNVGNFSRFLNFAAAEAGNIVNFSKISQQIDVAHTTISAYYQILEDCLIAERVEPFCLTSMRRKLIKSPKYLFFDLGVRRVCAGEGVKLPVEYMGRLFEQWVGLELIRYIHLAKTRMKVYFWRDANGPEVDWIVEKEGQHLPIEVKWAENPNKNDFKYLQLFREEYKTADNGYLVCRVPKKIKLADKIYAIPWQELAELFV